MSDIEFEVLSYNVNGIRDDRKRRKIFNFLKKQTSNKAVIFMQEIHSAKATEKHLAHHLSEPDADPECNYIFGEDWNLIFDTTLVPWRVAQN